MNFEDQKFWRINFILIIIQSALSDFKTSLIFLFNSRCSKSRFTVVEISEIFKSKFEQGQKKVILAVKLSVKTSRLKF